MMDNVDTAPALSRAGRRPGPHATGRAEQLLHDPEPDRGRAGRRAGAGRRQGALQGRADRAPSSPRRRRRRARRPPRSGSNYEDLPAVLDVEEALTAGAPLVNRVSRPELLHLRRASLPPDSLRRCRARASPTADHILEHTLPVLADRARADRDDRLHRHAGSERPLQSAIPTRRRCSSRSTTPR